MAKRRAKIKLSKAQALENDTNKWLAKKDAAIEQLIKAMDHLKVCARSSRRLQKAALGTLPPARKTRSASRAVAVEPALETKLPDDPRAYGLKRAAPDEMAELAQERGIEQEQRMKAMGFRKNKRTRSKAQPVV